MSALRQPKLSFTEQEYWSLEEGSEVKHEFFRGQIYPMGDYVETQPGRFTLMAGASPRHNDISGNTFAALKNQLRGRSCVPRTNDQRLKVEVTGLNTYPDILVACQPLRYDPKDKNTLLDATVIIEVLSASTAEYDRGDKFDNYRQLPSLRHYVLIDQAQVAVEHRHLDEATGEWRSETYASLGDTVNLEGIDCSLTLREIYEQVEAETSEQVKGE